MEKLQISEAEKSLLKQKALPYLPTSLDRVDAQREILNMIDAAVPTVHVCLDKAERETWPRVAANEVPMNYAVAQCAVEINKLIGITVIENLDFASLGEAVLLKAWIALDYYAYILKPEYSGHIKNLQEHLSGILLARQEKTAAVTPMDAVPETRPVFPPEDVPQTAPVVEDALTDKPRRVKKSRKGIAIFAVAAVLLAVIVIAAYPSFTAVSKVEEAITQIGDVSMESLSVIEAAEQMYAELSEKQQGRVENHAALTQARAEYDRLATAIQKASDAIDAIGTVSLESWDKIKKARQAYDALKIDGLTEYVADKYPTLTRAEESYEECCTEDLYNSVFQLYGSGAYQQALEGYESLLEKYPGCGRSTDAKRGIMECTIALASAEVDEGNLETALTMLDSVKQIYPATTEFNDLISDIETRLEKIRPANGKKFKDKIGWGWGELEVNASTKDVCIKLESVDNPENYMLFYVRAGETASVKVKNGDYILKYTTGAHWFGEDVMFGENAQYCKADSTLSYTSWREGSYVYYYKKTFTLYSYGGNLDATDIPADSF